MQEAIAGVVFAATILGLYLRPFGAKDWHVALAGAVIAWVAAPLSLREGTHIVWHSWNIIAFFLGLMLLSAGAEAAGLYRRVASALRAQPAGLRRVAMMLGIGAAITAILSNDATPLVLTPAIFAASVGESSNTMAAALAATFTADGASLLLPISNPVGLLFYQRFNLGFEHYALHILPAAAAGVAALALVTWLRAGHASAHIAPVPFPKTEALAPTQSSRFANFAMLTVGALASAYVAAAVVGAPLGLVTLGGGLVLCTGALVSGEFDRARFARQISPGLLIFVAALLVLVQAVASAGLLHRLSDLFGYIDDQPTLITIVGAALIATVLSNLMNNWPAALVVAATIALQPGAHGALIVGSLIGCTIGANLTMVGSLSTVFWLSLVRHEGADISPGAYVRAAALPTVAAVATACLVAAVTI
ncbi:MAG: SLC13 family permease [Tepidiformaceae bacterium]